MLNSTIVNEKENIIITSPITLNIGFLGCGNMGEAILKGVINSGINSNIFVYDKSKNEELKSKYNIEIVENEEEIGKKCDIIFLAVKPNVYFEVLDKIKNYLTDNIIVTMAPGITIESIENFLGKEVKVVRTMPNLPLMVQAGCIAYSFGKNLEKFEKNSVENLFKKIGTSIEIKEELFDAVVGASGSSPAFMFMFIEALADGVVYSGLGRKEAYQLIGQTMIGCGKMFLESGKHPGELKDNVCSPGGTTIVGVRQLEENNFRGAIIKAVIETIEKSKSMSK